MLYKMNYTKLCLISININLLISDGRKLGKSGIYLMNMKNAESQVEVTKKIV